MYNHVLKELIINFRLQDIDSFELIYGEFKNVIYYYAHKQKNEDIIGELTLFLIELLYKLDLKRFDDDAGEELRNYISVSIKNKYISICRKFAKDNIISREVYEQDLIYNGSAEMRLDICEALNSLTKRQKDIIICKYIYCLSDFQISEIFKISRQAVNRIKNRALKQLKEYYII